MRIRWFALSILVLISTIFWPGIGHASCVSVGAIRWDAWFGGKVNAVGRAVELSLGTQEFRARAPFCTRVGADGNLDIDCALPVRMDEEIAFANSSGIDYWVFMTYAENDPLSKSLGNYLSSNKVKKPKFSVVLTKNALQKNTGNSIGPIRRFTGYAKRDDFQTVLGNRPLFFFFPAGLALDRSDDIEWLRVTMALFRESMSKSGLGDPYLVLLSFNPDVGKKIAKSAGFDSISTYAFHGNGKGAPYEKLTSEAVAFWERAKATGAKVIPTAMAGWDRRPRVLHPVPWEATVPVRGDEIEYYYQEPTPEQLAEHVVQATRWVTANPDAAEANTVLVYAWNENDEGGWIIPTLGEGDARVRSLGKALGTACRK